MLELSGECGQVEVGGLVQDASSDGLVQGLASLRWVENSALFVRGGAEVRYSAMGARGRRSDVRHYKRWSGLESFARSDEGLRSVGLGTQDADGLHAGVAPFEMRLTFSVQGDEDDLGEAVADLLGTMTRQMTAISSGASWFGLHQAEPYTLWADSDFQGGSYAPPQPYLPGYSWGLVIPPLAAERLPSFDQSPAEIVRAVTSADGLRHTVAVLTRRPCEVDDDLLRRWRAFLAPALPTIRGREAPPSFPAPLMLLPEDHHA